MTEQEARWRGGGDEDDDDLNWIQTVVCSLVLLHYTSICFHLVRCFYRLTDWTGLFFFHAPAVLQGIRLWLLSAPPLVYSTSHKTQANTPRATQGQNYTSCFWNKKKSAAAIKMSLSFNRHKKGNDIRHCGKLNQRVSVVQRRNKQTLPSLVWNTPKDGLDLTRSSLVLFGFAYLCVCLLPI